jgi:hypothetical protein
VPVEAPGQLGQLPVAHARGVPLHGAPQLGVLADQVLDGEGEARVGRDDLGVEAVFAFGRGQVFGDGGGKGDGGGEAHGADLLTSGGSSHGAHA